MAYCLRYFNRVVKKTNEIGPLTATELNDADMRLIKGIQREHFYKELVELSAKMAQVSSKSKLFRLRPFIDERGLIRVGGRLKNASSLDMFQKHPIVLPKDCIYTKLLFQREHIHLLHGGPQAIISSIRLKYWPLNARNIARNTVYHCVKCFRFKPVIVQPIMGNLQRDRVEAQSRAFKICGIDFAGPITIKDSLRRKAATTKGYICIFVCFVTKAVHIEIVIDLSTKSFLNALNRFFVRRGKCTTIYSDNATNFVGANRQLQEIYQLLCSQKRQDTIKEYLAQELIEWRFIPPRSPHFGGLWESAIKSMKSLLQKVLGESYLTFEELCTILTRVEACLNSRPLTAMSSDPSNLTFLTPGHFLIGDSLMAIPERDETNIPLNRLDRWRCVKQYSQVLWKRWSCEYLHQLQERVKWTGERGPKVDVGTVVLIQEDNLPPLKWKIGRVKEVNYGDDGVIRAAVVKTENGETKRAVRKLCPLPFEGNVA